MSDSNPTMRKVQDLLSKTEKHLHNMFIAGTVFGALCCFMYAVILISATWLEFFGANSKGGAVDYWSKMFQLGIGLDDLRYPEWIQESFGVQERVQRWIAYLILPIGLALLPFAHFRQLWKFGAVREN